MSNNSGDLIVGIIVLLIKAVMHESKKSHNKTVKARKNSYSSWEDNYVPHKSYNRVSTSTEDTTPSIDTTLLFPDKEIDNQSSNTTKIVESTKVIPVIATAQPIVEARKINTIINEPLKKREPMTYSPKTHLFNVNKVKLEILLLSYIYTEDDGKISFSEKTKIKNHFRSFKNKLDEEDLESVKELMIVEPSMNNIRSHINQNKMDDSEVTNTLATIQSICGVNKDYEVIIKRIRKNLQTSISY